MDNIHKLVLGLFTAVVLCKHSQAQWSTTKEPANQTVSSSLHGNPNNSTDDDHRWHGHFSECPEEYSHYCIHGTCRFVQEQNTPSCRCEGGYRGSRCEYLDLGITGDGKQIVVICMIAALVFLLLLIVSICICVHNRHKLFRRRRKKKEEKGTEIEKLHATNSNEVSCLPAETSETNAV